MMSMNEFGKFIYEKRKEKSLTQESFASRLGITPQAVSKWENGIGYPDVSLFPEIAKVLEVSLDELFGNNEVKVTGEEVSFPKTVNELPRIAVLGNRACYSDKAVSEVSEGKVRFSDGSEADLYDGSVVNRGRGEVCFYEPEPEERPENESKETHIDRTFEPFSCISSTVNGSYGLEIQKAKDGIFRVKADGTPSFIASLEISAENGKLTIENKVKGNNFRGKNSVSIYVGFDLGEELELTVNGSGAMSVSPDFKKTVITVNGSGAVSTQNCGKVNVTVNGSGAMNLGACDDAVFIVNGSGDIDAKSAANTKIRISGSGDVNVGKVGGDADVTVHGSGDVTLSGYADKFTCNIDGSGDIHGEGLTVREADIRASGAGDISLGRICERSFEKLSKTSKLKVGRRG